MKNRTFRCVECGHVWRVAPGSGCPSVCPECESDNVGLAPRDRSKGRDRTHSRAERRARRFHNEEEDDYGAV